jgi:hypothetical protein
LASPSLDRTRQRLHRQSMRVYLYILNWDDVDNCEQGVPWAVDEREIFFGPCKRPLREDLCSEFLRGADSRDVSAHDLYVVGFNGKNTRRKRNVIWVGRIKSIMTFAHAWTTLRGPRYQEMREGPKSPLHLEPLLEDGTLIGYRHVNKLHSSEWLRDISSMRNLPQVAQVEGKEIRLHHRARRADVFNRDACMLLERCFYAIGGGLPVNDEMLRSIAAAHILRSGDSNTSYAVFGHVGTNGSADGLRGRYGTLTDANARRFLDAVTDSQKVLGLTDNSQQPRGRHVCKSDCS